MKQPRVAELERIAQDGFEECMRAVRRLFVEGEVTDQQAEDWNLDQAFWYAIQDIQSAVEDGNFEKAKERFDVLEEAWRAVLGEQGESGGAQSLWKVAGAYGYVVTAFIDEADELENYPERSQKLLNLLTERAREADEQEAIRNLMNSWRAVRQRLDDASSSTHV